MALRPPLRLNVVAIEKGAFWSPSTTVANFTYLLFIIIIIITNFEYPCFELFVGVQVFVARPIKRASAAQGLF